MKTIDTIVIGGGAAGLMAAGRAAERGSNVLLLEKMAQNGRKIGISGKGRCNITNSAELNDFIRQFGNNGRFLRQSFHHFFSEELISFFTLQGLPVVTERGGRVFPKSGKALDVVRTLNNWLQSNGVTTRKSAPVSSLLTENNGIAGVVCNGKKIFCKNVILATGGKSYPRTGSTGDGYKLAESGGHKIVPLRPALVPLVAKSDYLPLLNGLELKNIQVRLYINGKRKAEEFGELAFTAFGLTGPTILTLSGQVVDALRDGHELTLAIDLKPALDDQKLKGRLIRDFEKRKGEPVSSILRGLLPSQLVEVCLAECQIATDIDTYNFSAKNRNKIGIWLKNLSFPIVNHRSWSEAIITAGGVNLKEIDPRTMESKLVKGLFIAGELLDLHGNTGGYNLQAAFSTGWVAGSSVYL